MLIRRSLVLSDFKRRYYNCRNLFSTSGKVPQKKSPPQLKVKWYYATDIPEWKPSWYHYKKEGEPKNFIPFSDYDSSKIERRFQALRRSESDATGPVEVNEDRLFQVNLDKMILSPVYWEGPQFLVRRGTWFRSDGVPLASPEAENVEAGYHAIKPYMFDKHKSRNFEITKQSRQDIAKFNDQVKRAGLTESADEDDLDTSDILRLLKHKKILYVNAKDALIFPSSIKSSFEIGVIRNFGMGPIPLMSVDRIQRGFTEDLGETILDNITSTQIPSLSDYLSGELLDFSSLSEKSKSLRKDQNRNKAAEKQGPISPEEPASEIPELSMKADYEHNVDIKSSERKIEHLVLCIHGIGQILGSKYESVNFIHSINVLRNTMKMVFTKSDEFLNLLSSEKEKNNKVQVLPISWRHEIDFHPYEVPGTIRKDRNLPTLADINVDGVKSLRNILGDVVLDVLLYYEPMYKSQIMTVVTNELNRVYELYKKKNPDFKGKVHILGHSLGSSIAFDILSMQNKGTSLDKAKTDVKNSLSFDVDNLFCVGSPVGVFNLLKRKNIIARKALPEDYLPKEVDNFAAPKCVNLYNLFHPCDPVGYRMEPLVSPLYSKLKPVPVPFALKGINTQMEDLANFGDEIQSKIVKASTWFTKRKDEKSSDKKPLEDIFHTLIGSEEEYGQDQALKGITLDEKRLELLVQLNTNGRVDYSLPMGVFDFSLISAISAHISYFEDENTAGFIMRELLLAPGSQKYHKRKRSST